MGIEIQRYFTEAEKIGGVLGKVRLATLSRVTSSEAAAIADSSDLKERVEKAFIAVREQFGRSPTTTTTARVPDLAPARDTSAAGLRRHLDIFLELMSQRSLFIGDVDATVRRVTESASMALDCERVSVWFCDPEVTKITCADLFERTGRSHAFGTQLHATDFAPYFQAMKGERTIAAHDAHTDPRTSCFSAPYLKPLGINSMLDVPIWVDHKMVGVVCHEHVGPARTWNADEERFAYLMAGFVSLALERKR